MPVRTITDVDSSTQALLFAALGAVLGAGVVLAWGYSDRQLRTPDAAPEPLVPPGIATVLSGVALWLAALHQAVGALLVAAVAWGAHALGRAR